MEDGNVSLVVKGSDKLLEVCLAETNSLEADLLGAVYITLRQLSQHCSWPTSD